VQARSFQAVLLSGHKGNAAELPFDPGAHWSLTAQRLWPGRRGFPVHASLNGKPFDSAIVARARKFWLLVPTEISESVGLSADQAGLFAVAPSNASKPTALRGVGKAS
jgi:hypothetical protein